MNVLIIVLHDRHSRISSWCGIAMDTNDMKSNFYDELQKNRKNLAINTSFLSDEQYNEFIEIILELKAGRKKKQPKDFRLIKR